MQEALSMPTGDTWVITRPELKSGHERRPSDEQDETGRAIPPRALLGPMGIIQQVSKKTSNCGKTLNFK